MNTENLKEYFASQKEEANKITEILQEIEKTGANFGVYNGIVCTRANLFGFLNRIKARLEGVGRYHEKVENNEWRGVHEILIEKLAEKEHDYHLTHDGSHHLNCAADFVNKVLQSESENISKTSRNLLKNAANKIAQTEKYLENLAKEEWIQNRFFELASRIDFGKGEGLYPNVKELEEIHPLDVVSNGHVSLADLKASGNHKEVFSKELKSIKREALKETLLEEELKHPDVACKMED